MAAFDVFISFRRLDECGVPSRDARLAGEIAAFLRSNGLSVHLSGSREVDRVLKTARVLVAVAASPESLNSNEVRSEWEGFLNDVLSGINAEGEVVCYIDGLKHSGLPVALQQSPWFMHGEESLSRLLEHVADALNITLNGARTSAAAETPGDVKWLLRMRDSIATLNRAVPDRTALLSTPEVSSWFGLIAVLAATAWNRRELTIQPGPALRELGGYKIDPGQWEQAFLTYVIPGEGASVQCLLLTPEHNRFAINYPKLSSLMNSSVGHALQMLYGMPDNLRSPIGPEETEWCDWLAHYSAKRMLQPDS
jgi:hypothetical protein